jgi:hypothetical protein
VASHPVVRHIWVCQHSACLSPERIASHLHPYGHQDASLVPGRRQESGAFWNPCLPVFALPQQVHLQLAMIMHNDFEVIAKAAWPCGRKTDKPGKAHVVSRQPQPCHACDPSSTAGMHIVSKPNLHSECMWPQRWMLCAMPTQLMRSMASRMPSAPADYNVQVSAPCRSC